LRPDSVTVLRMRRRADPLGCDAVWTRRVRPTVRKYMSAASATRRYGLSVTGSAEGGTSSSAPLVP
jgi:hypothetical protein